MKKFVILAVAVATLAACAKVAPVTSDPEVIPDVEIKFQTASYATKSMTKADGDEFSTTKSFGTYAWSAASQLSDNVFMDDETVSFQTNAWKPSKTYYWPKTATVDFVSYYPQGASYITVAPSAITYTNFDLSKAANQDDILYADKAVGYGSNVNQITTNPATNYTGVPTLFRHALAKVSVKAALSYDRKKQQEKDGSYTVTKWAVKFTSASYGNLYYKGNLKLQLKAEAVPAPTIAHTLGWDVLDSEDAVLSPSAKKVWTSHTADKSAATAFTLANSGILTTTEASLLENAYVLPQALSAEAGAQGMSFGFTIKTYRKTDLTAEQAEAYMNEAIDFNSDTNIFLVENGTAVANFRSEEITAFEMAHNYTFNLKFAPTSGSGKTGDSDPDTDNPNLDDVTISFDPAVEGWTNTNCEATLYL